MLKSRIVDALGERSLLLPHLIERALAANARVKYLFALLQAAQAHAERPARAPLDLRAERLAAGVEDTTLDGVVTDSQRVARGRYTVPQAARIHAEVFAALDDMLLPLVEADGGQAATAGFQSRRAALGQALAAPENDCIGRDYLKTVTAASPGGGDSLHRLVMDLHKALNALQARIAVRRLDGAAVYGLAPGDEGLVTAFMRGLAQTAGLKFDHPGLGTTATRQGGRLILQNDIGTTDAHVLIVETQGLVTTLRYTDVHRKRARFFQSLFEAFDLAWADTLARHEAGLAEGGDFYLCTGRHLARDAREQERYLAFLGSRVVFLIDWNRARKRLRSFLPPGEAIEVLRWAANHNLGHRGFIQAGGEALVFGAIEQAGRGRIRYGQRLDEVVGVEAAGEFLRFVLRTATEGLLAGRSLRLIRDEVKAGLLKLFQSAEQSALAIACDHAALVAELAGLVRDGLLRLAAGGAAGADARRAKTWESRADELLNRLRELAQASPGALPYRAITEQADDSADSLEEAAFLLGLSAEVGPPAAVGPALARLATTVVLAAQEYVKAVECAAWAQGSARREDINDFLEAVDRAVHLEHDTDALEREVTSVLLRTAGDGRPVRLYGEIARCLEQSADALSRSALRLRDHLLGEVPVP